MGYPVKGWQWGVLQKVSSRVPCGGLAVGCPVGGWQWGVL